MKHRYNLALVPTTINKVVIDFARTFAEFSDSYCLGKYSLPHVTLRHFEANDHDLTAIWQEACRSLPKQPVFLRFNQTSYLSFDQKLYWLSLLPDQFTTLSAMHQLAASIVNLPAKINYEPHMTLLNTRDHQFFLQASRFAQHWTMIEDRFALALGESDAVGQLTKIIHQAKNAYGD